MSARGATAMADAEVRIYLHGDPGRGWNIAGRTARFQLTVEAPPYHACAVRTMTAAGFPDMAPYRALADRFESGGGYRTFGPQSMEVGQCPHHRRRRAARGPRRHGIADGPAQHPVGEDAGRGAQRDRGAFRPPIRTAGMRRCRRVNVEFSPLIHDIHVIHRHEGPDSAWCDSEVRVTIKLRDEERTSRKGRKFGNAATAEAGSDLRIESHRSDGRTIEEEA